MRSEMGYRVSGFGDRFCHSGDVRHRLRTWYSFGTGILALLLIPSISHAQHLRIFACAIANDSGMFLGGSSNGSGLYQSDDSGKTWKHLGWDNIKCYSMDEVDSSNGRILYEATGLGILRSTDYGAHWKQITDWRVDEAMDIAVNQNNPNEIYIATAHGPWRTEDGGKTWAYLPGINPPYCSRVIYASGSSGFNGFVVGAEAGLFWRDGNDTKWHFAENGPTEVHDIKVSRIKLRSGFGQKYRSGSERFITHWLVAGSGGLYISSKGIEGFIGQADKYRDLVKAETALCVCEDNAERIVGMPHQVNNIQFGGDLMLESEDTTMKNVTSCLQVGKIDILGTLDSGVQVSNRTELPGREIWTLKSFLVTP